MNVYRFECTVWVHGESAEAALKELHAEADYFFGLDNNLIALSSDDGTLVEIVDEDEEDTYGEEYCYNCGHYHDGEVSSGSWPAQGCADYEEPTEGESK
jgi:hypothetical protein